MGLRLGDGGLWPGGVEERAEGDGDLPGPGGLVRVIVAVIPLCNRAASGLSPLQNSLTRKRPKAETKCGLIFLHDHLNCLALIGPFDFLNVCPCCMIVIVCQKSRLCGGGHKIQECDAQNSTLAMYTNYPPNLIPGFNFGRCSSALSHDVFIYFFGGRLTFLLCLYP